MKKRLLMLLSLFMAITSVGWINAQSVTSQGGKLTKAILPKECKKTDLETKVSCFANGNPVRIYQGSDGFMVVEAKLDNGKVDTLKFLPGEFSVYGGSLGKKVDNSSITLENGKVYSLFGGGMYTNDSSNMPSGSGNANADVSGTASINVTGGSVTNLLVGGGRYYAKTNAVEINISTNESIANIYVGGYDQGGTTNTLATSLEASVNGVKTVKLTMNGGQVTEGIGCGGGQGYTYTGDSEIKLNGVTIGAFYGVLANGRADKIKATVTDCTFAALTKCYEFASVNRGTAGNIDFTFDGCSFNDLGKINACLGPINGWADSDTDGKVIPSVTGKAVFKFVNSKTATPVMQIGQGLETANIDLIGAKAAIKKFYKKTESSNPDDIISSFTLGAKKTWNFYNGLLTEDGTTLEQEGEGADKGILNNMYFANGKAITIEAGSNGAGAKIGTEEYDATLQVYGGSYKKDVAGSTNITMNGGAVKNIYGGGYGSNNKENDNLSADVQNVGIKINGGTVSNLVVGGGRYRAKANDVVITVSGDKTSLNNVICGGYDEGKTSNKLETTFDASVNRIANTTFTMTKGTIKGYLFVGGGQGCSYSKTAKATLNGTLLNYGVLGTGSNGRSDNVEVSLTGCTFAKADKQTGPIEIAALNRGIVNNASMTFKGCTFPENTKDYYCYSGATFQYDGTSTVKLGDVTMSFDGCTNTPVVGISSGLETANVTLNGAKASVAAFEASSSSTVKAFTIAKDKTWNLNGGLEFATEEDKTATLTNNGTLNVPATSIMSAIEVGGVLAVNAESTDVVAAMNEASNDNLTNKNFSIECKDGVIASNKVVAKELLKEGKVVMLLSFNEAGDGDHYSIASFQRTLAKITNLPDSVVYGTEPIKLAFNYKVAEAKISGTDNGIVKIENGVLTILKPGEVKLDITPDTNDDNKVDESDDADTKSTQTLKVTKRTLTLTAGIVPNYGDGSKGDSIVYNADTDVTLKWVTDNIKVSGLPWEVAASAYFNTSVIPAGSRANKNVGDKVPVTVNEIAIKDSSDYYTLAPITFVTAKVVKAQATVTAKDASNDFGKELPTFGADISVIENSGDQLDGTLKFICPATPDSLVKKDGYAIMPYGLTSDNYAIKYVAGKLTVKPTNPKIEIVDSKVIGTTGAKTITVQAKLVHAGGLETATVTAKDAESEVTSASENAITPDANGIYKFEVANAAAKKHTITFTATTTESSNNTGTASIDVTVEAGTPQNLKFDDKVLSSIVYGDSLPLIVLSDQSAAIGKYTFSAKEGEADAAIISANNVLKPSKAGDVVVTVSREADETYSSATITKTIKVNPRPLKASVAAFTPKTYDGSVTATVLAITLSADYKVIGTDKVNIKTDVTPTATYASKNVGTHAITLSTLELEGAQAANYTLIQPTGLKGEITKKDATVKVDDVTRMYNQRYTKYTFTTTGLIKDESLSSVYTGKLEVTENEKEGKLILKIDGSLCQNYNLKPEDGELTVTKGTPVVVAYNGNNGAAQALVVDSAGHQSLTVSKDLVDGYFLVTGDDKKVTKSVNAISSAQTTALLSTKAGDEWTGWNSEQATTIEYAAIGQTITNVSDYTYSSTDLNRLSINGTDLTASGVGKVAIIATNTTSGDVKVKLYDVKPKTVTYKAEMNKTYDGLTQATGTVTLEGVEGNDNVVLDLEGVTFNYTSPKAKTTEINPSQAPILAGTDANNYNLVSAVSGEIAKKEITVSTPISAYYTGKTIMTLNEFTSDGVLSNDIVSLKVRLDKAEVGPRKFTLIELEGDNAGNYTLSQGALDGTILKPTIVVTVPETAPSESEVKNRLTYTIRETGEVVSKEVFGNNVKVVSLGNNVYQVSTTVEDPNYSLVYTKNLIGYKSEGSDTPGGDGDETVTISLDATTKTLPRNEEFVLKATVSNGKTVTWSSSDPTIASVTADGNKATVKGLKVGKATITAKIGDVTASCEVTVDFATGLEEALANTQVYAKQGNIYVNPVQPLQLTIVNMIGKVVYNARISSYAQIPVAKGIYIVKLTNAGNTVVTKVNVY